MQSIDFQGVTFIPDAPLSPISIQALESTEAQLGFTFPEDYRAFITTLGVGETEFGIRVFPPEFIFNSHLLGVQNRLSEFWFWDKSPEILTQTQAVECVPFFDSSQGDDILFHPSDRSRWFILQHGEESIVVVHSFQELCAFYLRHYDELQAPYTFYVWTELD
jgi:hypothetical protein